MPVDISTARIYLHGFDMSGDSNKHTLENPLVQLIDTGYADTSVSRKRGLGNPKLTATGYVNTGASSLHENLRTNQNFWGVPTVVAQDAGIAGAVAHFFRARESAYKVTMPHGQIMTFELAAVSTGRRLVRGYVFVAAGNKTTSGVSAVIQLGAAATGQKVYATAHVFAKTGTPTLDITVKSSAVVGLTSPTTRLSFTQFTSAFSSEWRETAGVAIADQYYRVDYTIAGGSPSISFVVIVGIL